MKSVSTESLPPVGTPSSAEKSSPTAALDQNHVQVKTNEVVEVITTLSKLEEPSGLSAIEEEKCSPNKKEENVITVNGIDNKAVNRNIGTEVITSSDNFSMPTKLEPKISPDPPTENASDSILNTSDDSVFDREMNNGPIVSNGTSDATIPNASDVSDQVLEKSEPLPSQNSEAVFDDDSLLDIDAVIDDMMSLDKVSNNNPGSIEEAKVNERSENHINCEVNNILAANSIFTNGNHLGSENSEPETDSRNVNTDVDGKVVPLNNNKEDVSIESSTESEKDSIQEAKPDTPIKPVEGKKRLLQITNLTSTMLITRNTEMVLLLKNLKWQLSFVVALMTISLKLLFLLVINTNRTFIFSKTVLPYIPCTLA